MSYALMIDLMLLAGIAGLGYYCLLQRLYVKRAAWMVAEAQFAMIATAHRFILSELRMPDQMNGMLEYLETEVKDWPNIPAIEEEEAAGLISDAAIRKEAKARKAAKKAAKK